MFPPTSSHQPPADSQGQASIQCDACESVLYSRGEQAVAFLLVDRLRVPLVGCDEHLDQFTDICGFTTEETVELLNHRPAGGINCPNCHLAPYNSGHPVVPVQTGAVAVLACPEHQIAAVERFQAGLETRHQLTSSLDRGQ